MATTRKVIIIGSGPAGYTAAIYGARANLAPLMLSGVQAGGQLMLTTLVENYPGFGEGIQGPELMEIMKKQAEHFGTEMITEDVTSVDFSKRPFGVKTDDQTFEGHTVIIATRASAKLLDVDKGKVTTVRLKNVKTDALHERPVDGLFVAIGHEPNTQIFRGQIELLPNGYVKVKTGTTQTSVPGVFAAGDVQDFTYRQAVTAAGTGCMAALEAERYLEATQPH